MQHKENVVTLETVERERERERAILYKMWQNLTHKLCSTTKIQKISTYVELNSQIGFVCVAENNIIGYILETKKLTRSF